MSIWKTMPKDEPVDATICWVRLNYWFGEPFLAQWNTATNEWTSVVNTIVYPAWTISRWRYQ